VSKRVRLAVGSHSVAPTLTRLVREEPKSLVFQFVDIFAATLLKHSLQLAEQGRYAELSITHNHDLIRENRRDIKSIDLELNVLKDNLLWLSDGLVPTWLLVVQKEVKVWAQLVSSIDREEGVG
jgi:hypothetical protein